MLILIRHVVFWLDYDTILDKSLVLFIKHRGAYFDLIKAVLPLLITLTLLTLLVTLILLMFLLIKVYLRLRQHPKPVINQRRVHRAHRETSVLPVKEDRQEGAHAGQTLVDLVEAGLDHFELLATALQLGLHVFGGVHASGEIVGGRWLVEKLSLKEEFSFQIAWRDIDLRPEFDDVPEHDELLSVPNEECLRVKTICLLHNVGLDQAVIRNFACTFIGTMACRLVNHLRVLGVVVVRIGIIDLVLSLIKDLELHEVETLLNEVDISEVLQM